jgi:hypothetical protein
MPASRIEHACGSSRCYWRRIWPPQLSCCPLESKPSKPIRSKKQTGRLVASLDSSFDVLRRIRGHLIRAI